MRKDIRDLSLEKIYNDYRQLKAIDERYFHCGNNIVFNKAAEALMALLKEEITKRKLFLLIVFYHYISLVVAQLF